MAGGMVGSRGERWCLDTARVVDRTVHRSHACGLSFSGLVSEQQRANCLPGELHLEVNDPCAVKADWAYTGLLRHGVDAGRPPG